MQLAVTSRCRGPASPSSRELSILSNASLVSTAYDLV